MKTAGFKALGIVLLLSISAHASYSISYRGMHLGSIENFDTLADGYLVANVENFAARVYTRFRNHVVFYKESKPDINSAKFEKDRSGFIDILLLSKTMPKKKSYKVRDNRFLTIRCDKDKNRCLWEYADKNKVRSYGFLQMKNGAIYELKDQERSIVIKQK